MHVALLSQNADMMLDVRPREQASALAAAGFDVSLVGGTNTVAGRPSGLDERVRFVAYELPTAADGALGQVREQGLSLLRSSWTLARLARRHPIHVLQSGNPPDNAWLILPVLRLVQGFAPRFVFDQHDPSPLLLLEKFGDHRLAKPLFRAATLLERLSLRRAALALFANDAFCERARGEGLISSPAAVIPNGWRLPQPANATWEWRDSSRPLLVYVGTTNSQDCIDHLVETIGLVKHDVQVAVAGDGDGRSAAQALAADLGISDRIEWLGWVRDRRELAALVSAADVCVAPEVETELNALTSFVKVGEYMSAGAAIVAHRLPQTERVAGAAVAYAAGMSSSALADSINELLDEPARIEALRDAARERFDQYIDWENVGAPRLVDAYRSAFAVTA